MINHRPPPWPNSATLAEIPGGADGTRAVIATMLRLIREARRQLPVRTLAVMIIAGLPHKAYAEQAQSVQRWVRSNIQFVRDVRGTETLTPPAYLIRTRAGDCDDQAMLVAALVESIGLPARLVVGGPNPQRFTHVWAEVRLNGQWFALETSEPWPMGRRPQFATYRAWDV